MLLAQPNPTWTTPIKPFKIMDNLYYVGSEDLAAYLVATPLGNILINANLVTSPAQIKASVEALGFSWGDTRILLNSQGHYDHVAGSAEVVKETRAKVEVMDGDVAVMESGGAKDFASLPKFPPVHVDKVLRDGDTVKLGGVTLTARKTAGHTRGCTTWTMQVEGLGGTTLDVVIIGGMAALDEYRLVATPGHPASYKGIAEDFERTFVTLKGLHCDIFLGGHGSYFGLKEKVARMANEGQKVWIDPEGYRTTVAEAQAAFEKRLAADRAKTQGGAL
jgi:metallo-beta-lactamase class B